MEHNTALTITNITPFHFKVLVQTFQGLHRPRSCSHNDSLSLTAIIQWDLVTQGSVFSVECSEIWNSLPSEVKMNQKLSPSVTQYKIHFIDLPQQWSCQMAWQCLCGRQTPRMSLMMIMVKSRKGKKFLPLPISMQVSSIYVAPQYHSNETEVLEMSGQ